MSQGIIVSRATASDGVGLHCESTGSGTPIVFVHEFGDDHRSWEPQIRYFSRRYQCVTFTARGFPPSDIPPDVAAYSQQRAVDDIADVMDHFGIDRAHIMGCSMGGFAALHFGLRYAQRARSIAAIGAGYGAEKQHEQYFRNVSAKVADNFETIGAEAFAPTYGSGASRVQYQNKDPRGWQEFIGRLAEHSSLGAANTMRGVQMQRPSLYDLADEFRRMHAPTLVIVGDEDDHCLQPGIFLKQTIPACGLLVIPKTGHAANLEEPALVNDALAEFIAMVETGHWLPRDPRARPDQIMQVVES